MTPFISKILSRDCITVQHNQTLRDVAKTLTENSIGAVPVLNGFGALVGILSERDLVQSLPQDIDLDSHMASDLMTADLDQLKSPHQFNPPYSHCQRRPAAGDCVDWRCCQTSA